MILAFLAAAATAMAPPASAEELRSQIIAADDVLFERAFNQCDLDALHDILMPDAEMVHDQAGVNRGREAFMAPVREHIAMVELGSRSASGSMRASRSTRSMRMAASTAQSSSGGTSSTCARKVSRCC